MLQLATYYTFILLQVNIVLETCITQKDETFVCYTTMLSFHTYLELLQTVMIVTLFSVVT